VKQPIVGKLIAERQHRQHSSAMVAQMLTMRDVLKVAQWLLQRHLKLSAITRGVG
jgi:hypothetical protein